MGLVVSYGKRAGLGDCDRVGRPLAEQVTSWWPLAPGMPPGRTGTEGRERTWEAPWVEEQHRAGGSGPGSLCGSHHSGVGAHWPLFCCRMLGCSNTHTTPVTTPHTCRPAPSSSPSGGGPPCCLNFSLGMKGEEGLAHPLLRWGSGGLCWWGAPEDGRC